MVQKRLHEWGGGRGEINIPTGTGVTTDLTPRGGGNGHGGRSSRDSVDGACVDSNVPEEAAFRGEGGDTCRKGSV